MRSSKRPRSITLLGFGVVALSGFYLARLILGLDLPDIPLSIPRWYLPFTGAAWGVTGIAAAYSLFCGRSWAPAFVRWSALAFAVWYWSDRLFLARSQYLDITWPASLAVSSLAILVLFWILSRPAARRFFGEGYS